MGESVDDEVLAEEEAEHARRYRAVRLAVAGEWSALARQLKLWGIEALE